MQLSVGTVLKGGEYRIDGQLGQGGFGITYRATQTALGRTVAIKEFFIESMNVRGSDGRSVEVAVAACRPDYDSQRDKFRREARRLSAFDNRHIVRVLDLFDENDTSYYVMEYLEGESLDRRLRRSGRMSEAEVMGVVDDVLDALAAMHAVSLWHLDLKPGNLIRTPAGTVKVIDFGASKMVAGGRVTLLSSTTSLTPGYAPLEQMGGAVTQFGPWTDLYALGATVYALLSGNRPPLPSALLGGMGALQWPADVSAETRALVEWMLQPSPQARPQSVADVRGRKGTSRQPNDDSGGNTRTFTVNGVSFTMVRVAGGTFTMGATAEQGSDAFDREKPAHEVTLSDFAIGQTEVTQELWVAVMGSNPSNFSSANGYAENLQRPVEYVSWEDCQTFISKLNALTGQRFRLPTEAEWEYAARGGRNSRGYKYAGSDKIGEVAWYCENSHKTTHPVGTKAPNELGLYDMSGNVWEWCADWYGDYGSSSQTNPTGPTSGSNRVSRGGCWFSYARYCRVSSRDYVTPTGRSSCLGLRLGL